MFGWRDYKPWTFGGFSMMLAQTVATYLAAALVLPDVRGDDAIDLRAYYYANHRWFFAMGILTMLASIGKDLVLNGHVPQPPTDFITQVVFMAFLVVCALTAREWVHKIFAPLATLLFIAYIAALFMRLH